MGMRTIGSCGQLTTSGKSVGHEALEENRIEVCPGQVDGGGVSCRSRADDDLEKKRSQINVQVSWEGQRTTLECIFLLLSFLPVTGAIWRFMCRADVAEREERIVLLRRADLENRVSGLLEGKEHRLINPSPLSFKVARSVLRIQTLADPTLTRIT